MHLKELAVLSSFLLAAGFARDGLSAPGTISATNSTTSTIMVGETFAVTLRLSGYTDTFEIDSWNVRITYDSSIFSYVAGSATFGSALGPDPQWLSKANQNLDPTYSPTPFSDEAISAGTLLLSLTDLGLLEFPDRGSLSADGFLVSFSLMGTSVGGPSSITPSAPADGNVFYDSASFTPNPGGTPVFTGTSMEVVPEPQTAVLLLTGAVLCFVWQRKRRR